MIADGDGGLVEAVRDDEIAELGLFLSGTTLFREVGSDRITVLLRAAQPLAAPAGTVLIRMNDPSDYALLIIEGEVDVSIQTDFSAVPLATIPAPCLVGEVGVFTGVNRTADVRARTPVRALRLAAESLLAVGETNPKFLAAAMRDLGRRIETFNRAIGFYTDALSALQRYEFDLSLLEALRNPLPELVHFSNSFRQLAEEIMLRKSQRQEMASAAAIQRSMLPEPIGDEVLGGRVVLEADMRPAKDVGGDLFDLFMIDADRLVVTIGDVSGKGVPASLFMTATQTVMRIVLRGNEPLAAQMKRANDLLAADNREMMFVTFVCAVIDLRSGLVAYCNAGHNPPLVLRADGRCEPLPHANPLLGIVAGVDYEEATVELGPGDRLLMFTDGLPEALDGANEPFGEERLAETAIALHRAGDPDFVGRLHNAVAAFVGDAPQFDDLTSVSVLRMPFGQA